MDDDAFDVLVSRSDTAMVVVTTTDGTERAGCLVGFHCQSSIEPLRYAVWLSKANRTYRVARDAEHLVVHFLDRRERALAELFGGETGDEIDKFARVEWEPGPGGVPVLTGCRARLVVRRVDVVDLGGDHVCIETEPLEAVASPDLVPLRFEDVADIDPGHEAD